MRSGVETNENGLNHCQNRVATGGDSGRRSNQSSQPCSASYCIKWFKGYLLSGDGRRPPCHWGLLVCCLVSGVRLLTRMRAFVG